MKLALIQRRTLWWPTLLGWCSLVVLAIGATALWWFEAEAFFSVTERQPGADVLVVESWIGLDGLQAATAEFERGGYRWLVSAGGLSNNPWDRQRWNLAQEAADDLIRQGLPSDKVIVACQKDTEGQRTFETAVAARQALRSRGIQPKAVNLFTKGAHCRRSRLIFAKVFAPEIPVGVVCYPSPGYNFVPWWRSSERAEDLIKETVGYPFEVLLNSGRLSNNLPANIPLRQAR